jgi:hypothetical protein
MILKYKNKIHEGVHSNIVYIQPFKLMNAITIQVIWFLERQITLAFIQS